MVLAISSDEFESMKKNEEPTNEEESKNNSFSEQKKVLWTVSIGNNSSQLILLNFFQYFAAKIVPLSVLGFLTAIRNLFGALFQGRIGLWSDKKGRKLFLILGFFLSFSFTTLLIFSYNAVMLIIVATAQALSFSIIIPVWNATLGDVTVIKGRTTIMGKLNAAGQVVGVVLMLLLSGVFYFLTRFKGWIIWGIQIQELDWKLQYGIVFAVCAFLLLLCVISLAFYKETRDITKIQTQPKMKEAFQNKDFRKFIIVNSIFGITMAALWPIYPVIQAVIIEMEVYQLTIAAAIYVIFFSIGGFIGGKIGDQVGRKPVLLFSRLIMFSVSLLYIPAVLFNNWYFVILTNVVSGIGNGVFAVIMNAYALDLSTDETLGSYSGLSQASWGIATFVGSLIFGFISQALTNSFGDVIMVLSTTIAIAIMRVIASIGYFFIKESLSAENRLAKKKVN